MQLLSWNVIFRLGDESNEDENDFTDFDNQPVSYETWKKNANKFFVNSEVIQMRQQLSEVKQDLVELRKELSELGQQMNKRFEDIICSLKDFSENF